MLPSIQRLLHRWLEKDRKEPIPDIAVARFELKEAITAPDSEPGAATGFPSRRSRERLAWIVAGVSIAVAMMALARILYVRSTVLEPVGYRQRTADVVSG